MSIFEVNVFNIHQSSINLPDLAESTSSQRSLVLASANSAKLVETHLLWHGTNTLAIWWKKKNHPVFEKALFSGTAC